MLVQGNAELYHSKHPKRYLPQDLPWYSLFHGLRCLYGAKAAGFSAIVVTIDTPISGLRERDVRNGTKQ